MVRHRDRKWEMPGGRLLKGENHEQAAVREFFEETGMSLEIIGHIRLLKPGGKVFVGIVRDELKAGPTEYNILEVKEFTDLPDELSFPLVECRVMLVQAKRMFETFKRGKNIDGSA